MAVFITKKSAQRTPDSAVTVHVRSGLKKKKNAAHVLAAVASRPVERLMLALTKTTAEKKRKTA
jgi:hypothetical protein